MILLVEDEKRAREVFVEILKNAGYGVMLHPALYGKVKSTQP